jgi:hypothetical protein
MISIAITAEAFEAIAATMPPPGSVGYEVVDGRRGLLERGAFGP